MTLQKQVEVLQDIAIAQAENMIAMIETQEVINRPIQPIISTEEISALEEQGVNCNIRSIIL